MPLALVLALHPLHAQQVSGDSLQDSGSSAVSQTFQSDASQSQPGLFSKLLRSFGLQRSPAKRGNRAYHRQDYDQAARDYAEARENPPSPEALQILSYNAGNAEFRQKRYPEAIADYAKALQGKDAGLAARAHYNMGNAFFRKGEAELLSGRQEGLSDYREALAHYKKSLEIAPSNADAKRNMEVTQVRIKELLDRQQQQEKQQQQQQQQQKQSQPQKPAEPDARAKEALARAMQLVQQGLYEEARTVLEDAIRQNPTAASYKEPLQRIDDVIKIQKGQTPAPPVPLDPRAQQHGLGVP